MSGFGLTERSETLFNRHISVLCPLRFHNRHKLYGSTI